MSLSGDPGCGPRGQESPLYSLACNLVLQLRDPQVRRAGISCRRGTTSALFWIRILDCLFFLYLLTPGYSIPYLLHLILTSSPHSQPCPPLQTHLVLSIQLLFPFEPSFRPGNPSPETVPFCPIWNGLQLDSIISLPSLPAAGMGSLRSWWALWAGATLLWGKSDQAPIYIWGKSTCPGQHPQALTPPQTASQCHSKANLNETEASGNGRSP